MSQGNRRSPSKTKVLPYQEGLPARILSGFLTLPLLFILTTASLHGAGTTGAESLLAGIGARPSALGGAYTALANDPFALVYNPSGLARLKRPMLSLMHSEWIEGSQMQFAALALPGKSNVLGISFYRMDMGRFTGRDSQGKLTNDFSAGDLALSLGLARQLSPRLLLGAKASYFEETLAQYKANTFLGDIGMMLAINKKLVVGAAIQNLGPGLKFVGETAKLPLTYALGAAYNVGGIRLAADYKIRPEDPSNELALGMELAPAGGESLARPLTLRIGHNGFSQSQAANALQGFGAGFGLALGNINLDYAFQPFGLLGNTHRMSVGIKF